ncbi:MAG: RagB/SusD family nutrient uptake outer membrane protein [Gemmatimonadetes bacterium]|nr:RagB/SusD family nutrient uptake outer membrane protein [Gemmatimonadota bacterium]
MNRIQGLSLALGVALLAAGCDDDFLTTLPPDQVASELFWTQQKDADLAVVALYNQIQGDVMTFRMEGASDNAWAQKSFDSWFTIGNGSMDPLNGTVNGVWNTAYVGIARANEILANIDRIPTISPVALKDRYKGEAAFHRAYHYIRLVNLYGDVPLVLKPLTIEEGEAMTRSPRAQVVDQIFKDLDFAASVLPTTYSASERGRVTRGAALAYKARAALYEGRWQVAANSAKAVMDLNMYRLHPNYAELTRYAGDNSAELIFTDVREKGVRGQGTFGSIGQASLLGVSDVTPLRELIDSYQMKDGLPTSQSTLDTPAQPYADRDPRMYATLVFPGATYCGVTYNSLPGSKAPDEVRKDFNTTSTGFNFTKYVDCADRTDRGNSGVDFILMRYADVLLMFAEAKIELGQIDQSVYDALNAVRTRAGMPAIPVGRTQQQLRDAVRYERRAELVLEGQRLFDIRRWRIAEQVMPGQKFGIDWSDRGVVKKWIADNRSFNPARDYLWPIPQRELGLMPGLTQNPGY